MMSELSPKPKAYQSTTAMHALGAVIRWARHLVLTSGMHSPPVNPSKLAAIQHVVRIETVELESAGMLIPLTSGGFAIRVNRNDSLERQNFTCCHEIVHTLFFDSRAGLVLRADPHAGVRGRLSFEEYLCDRGAAELLMPKPWFEASVKQFGVSVSAIPRLAARFAVSREVAAMRMAHSDGWKVCVIKWKFMSRPGSVSRLRVDWAAVPDDSRLYIPRWKPAAEDSPVHTTYETGQASGAYYELRLGNLKGKFHIESAKLHDDSVLTLVHLAGMGA